MSETQFKALTAKLESNALAYEMLGEKQLPALLRVAAAALAPQWQPIESAPKDGRPLLLDHPDWHSRVMRGGWDAHELAWRVHGFGCPATQPSHWQPLPAPPEVEG